MQRKTGPKIIIQRAIVELRTARGKWRFTNATISAAVLSFLVMEGALMLALAAMISDYGIDRVAAELQMISAADALQGIWHLFSNNMPMVAAVSVLVGIMFGLKSASETPARSLGSSTQFPMTSQ